MIRFLVFLIILLTPIHVQDTLTPAAPLTGNQTLISSGGNFELGFFSLGNNSGKWYVGIWYKKILPVQTVVWVANRDRPLSNSSGELKIGEDGNIYLVDANSKTVWSSVSPESYSVGEQRVAQLLDSGNFVLNHTDHDRSDLVWQSFDYPTDTLLAGMKLGWDAKSGLNRNLTAWKSTDDPSPGRVSFVMNTTGFPEIFMIDSGTRTYRSGPWNGVRFSGVPEMNSNTKSPEITFEFITTTDEVTYSYEVQSTSFYSRLTVDNTGYLKRLAWIDDRKTWNFFWLARRDVCDVYRDCGSYGICDTNAYPVCKCSKGFSPADPRAWSLRDGTAGCLREHQLNCSSDGFLKLPNMKLPESSAAAVNTSLSLSECQKKCSEDCKCTGYANSDIRNGGSGCATWTGDLVDMRQYAAVEGGQDFYIRVSASDLDQVSKKGRSDQKKRVMIVSIAVVCAVVISLIIAWLVHKKIQSQRIQNSSIHYKGHREKSQEIPLKAPVLQNRIYHSDESTTTEEFELPMFDFDVIALATGNFSQTNKLGQGGFGIVYKGLLEGQDVAVKRLSKTSVQGMEEFKNEVRLIAKLQHRNLVRLLGCCVYMQEKMLIYEYLENKSLDSILFNQEKRLLLHWQRRFSIINGIARGLLYLHQDSRFRIIHRDLKASNILLDKEMRPKISDFGMARIFGGDETEAETRRVVGTYGYMAPEYAMDGIFSIKSDVFSFGVLVLEIVSGHKNRGFYHMNNQLSLLAHAWKLWSEGRGLELLDSAVGEGFSSDEVIRCIQVGLLCVQEQAEDRPNMATVVLLLSSESASLPHPKHPGFCLGRRPNDTSSSSTRPESDDPSCTVNQVTITLLDGR